MTGTPPEPSAVYAESKARTVRILGIDFEALTQEDLDDLVAVAIAEGQKVRIGNHNLHSAYLCRKMPALREIFQKVEHLHCDGMSLIGWARCMGFEIGREHRVTYVDWIHSLCRHAVGSGWRIFHLGGVEASAGRGVEVLRQQYPGLDIRFHNGFFDMAQGGHENTRVLEAISDSQPNILTVGMGMPRQELWVAENLAEIEANVVLMVGACLDYVAGTAPTPPRWSGGAGLEWLFRLAAEPRRLGWRYVVEPFQLAPLFLQDLAVRLGLRS